MEVNQSQPVNQLQTQDATEPETTSKDQARGGESNLSVDIAVRSGRNSSSQIMTEANAPPPEPSAPYISDMNISTTLPARPTAFHGREYLVDSLARLLIAPGTARLAIVGPAGMGKTTVALAILHDPQIIEYFDSQRLFLSCEALMSAEAVVASLAKLIGVPISGDLLTAVIVHLTNAPHTVLLLDNIKTVWLASGGPVSAVEELLARLAQVPSLSLIITCHGNVLPKSVEWSNAHSAELRPFSLEAALETFQDRAGRRLSVGDTTVTKQLLSAVDRIPTAVSLLGQLVRRGNLVSELLSRFNREYSTQLPTYRTGQMNYVDVSIELSIAALHAAENFEESLQLLMTCSLLPDGMSQEVFEKLRPRFSHIDLARDDLISYALASLDINGVLKAPNPIRRRVLVHHPEQQSLRDALHVIYRDIARSKRHAADAKRVIRDYRHAEEPLNDAQWIYSNLGDNIEEARCRKDLGVVAREKGDHPTAIEHLSAARQIFNSFGETFSAANCSESLGIVYCDLRNHDSAAVEFETARATYLALGNRYYIYQSTRFLAGTRHQQGDFSRAELLMEEVETFCKESGDQGNLAESARQFGYLRRDQGGDCILQVCSGSLPDAPKGLDGPRVW